MFNNGANAAKRDAFARGVAVLSAGCISSRPKVSVRYPHAKQTDPDNVKALLCIKNNMATDTDQCLVSGVMTIISDILELSPTCHKERNFDIIILFSVCFRREVRQVLYRGRKCRT